LDGFLRISVDILTQRKKWVKKSGVELGEDNDRRIFTDNNGGLG